ncbi:MAG: sigma-70 family RNA polymerase sigma factor [Pseudomonadota bacterium]
MTEKSPSSAIDPVMLAELPDEALVARIAQDKDRGAFTELFDRYAGRIKAFLIRAGASREEAEEAAQEVFVTIWRRAETFNPERAGAATWLYTIARNKRIDMVRRIRRPEPEAEDLPFAPGNVESAEVTLAGVDRDARIREAIMALPDDQRLVIRLAFFAGMSHAEIAQRLEAPLGTVKSRLRLSFAKLRDELGSDFALELLEN